METDHLEHVTSLERFPGCPGLAAWFWVAGCFLGGTLGLTRIAFWVMGRQSTILGLPTRNWVAGYNLGLALGPPQSVGEVGHNLGSGFKVCTGQVRQLGLDGFSEECWGVANC